MKVINPLSHPHSGKAAILFAVALALGITIHEAFFLVALLIACIEWGAHEVHVLHELHEEKGQGSHEPASKPAQS